MENTRYLSPRAYEMMAILLPDQGDEETTAAIEKMLSYITDEQGTVDSVASDSPWGRRRLAYTVRHEGVDYRDGHYVLVYFTAMPSAISEIERELKLDTNVIRYLLLTHDPHMGEQIDVTALETEGAETSGDAETETAAADTTEAPAETAVTAGEAPAETAGAPIDEAPAVTAEAPAEELAAETTEAPAEEAAAAEDTTADDMATDAVATEDVVAEAGTEEGAVAGEVEESTEE